MEATAILAPTTNQFASAKSIMRMVPSTTSSVMLTSALSLAVAGFHELQMYRNLFLSLTYLFTNLFGNYNQANLGFPIGQIGPLRQ